MNKRKLRRLGGKNREYMSRLDKIAQAKIDRSFMSSMATWGGTRCSGCGIQVRPAHLTDKRLRQPLGHAWIVGDGKVVGTATFSPTACDWISCPGEVDNWIDLVCEGKRK